MGVLYYVACKDCKVSRDLDKFYTLHGCQDVKNRKIALESCDEVAKDSFRCTLLLSFLSNHYGHNILMFDDCSADEEFELYPEETIDFWSDHNEGEGK